MNYFAFKDEDSKSDSRLPSDFSGENIPVDYQPDSSSVVQVYTNVLKLHD